MPQQEGLLAGVGVERGAYPSVSGEHNRQPDHVKSAKLLSGARRWKPIEGHRRTCPETQPIGPLVNASSLAFTAQCRETGHNAP